MFTNKYVFQKQICFKIGRPSGPQTPLQMRGAAPPAPPAIPGGCVRRTPCNTGGLRPPDPLHYRAAAPPGPPVRPSWIIMDHAYIIIMIIVHVGTIYYGHSTCMYSRIFLLYSPAFIIYGIIHVITAELQLQR